SGFYILMGVNLDTNSATIALVSFVQGLGSGLIFLPMMMLIFTTLPEKYKNEGATLTALMRNLGAAVGVSVLHTLTLRDLAASQARLVEQVRPDNPVFSWRQGEVDLSAPIEAAAQMGQVGRQALMLAYHHTFEMMFLLSLSMVVICLAMKPKKESGAPSGATPMMID
ncbi:MAG: EmrB/QacA family drug resistance transporter, partial [Novosphingobium sp.]